jgi:tRNA (mo5U34)-methyltransferase
MTHSLASADIQRRVDSLGDWFHNIDLAGVKTAPQHFLGDYPSVLWGRLSSSLPQDLSGKTVLDVGCNAGFYSIEMKRRGAARVVGLDTSDRYLSQARLAAEVCGAEIELRKLSVYDVAKLGEQFDIVLLMGVIYHLRHPLLALDLVWEHAARDLLIFQSMQRGSSDVEPLQEDYVFAETGVFDKPGFPKLHFVERAYCNDGTNWWIPNRACAEAMLRSAGFAILENPVGEVYVCRRARRELHVAAVYPARRGRK